MKSKITIVSPYSIIIGRSLKVTVKVFGREDFIKWKILSKIKGPNGGWDAQTK